MFGDPELEKKIRRSEGRNEFFILYYDKRDTCMTGDYFREVFFFVCIHALNNPGSFLINGKLILQRNYKQRSVKCFLFHLAE